MLAGEEADRIGKRYLKARFEHQAQEAGLYVDPSVFEVDVNVDPVADEVSRLQEELVIYDAILAALDDPHGILDAILQSEDEADARATLGARYGFDDAQAQAVVDNLSRGATRTHRRRLEQRQQELRHRLQEITGRDPS